MRKLSIFLLLSATACSQATPEPQPAVPKHTVHWRVDDTDVTVDHWVSGTGPGPVCTIYGREYVDGHLTNEVQFELPNAVGTYPLSQTATAWATYYDAKSGIKYYAGATPGLRAPTSTGTLVLSELANQQATGTFTFTGVDPATGATKTIANGTFHVSI